MKPLSECRLYAFVDTAYLAGRPASMIARELCDGGADILQLRAKEHSPAEVRELAEEVLPVTRAAGVPLVVNDHLQVAQETGAEFCHLGQEDFFGAGFTHVSELTCVKGGHPLGVGLSTHAPEQALRAASSGADYLGIGPVYPTGTKPSARPVTLEYVRWAAGNLTLPWFAIGGINLENVEQVLVAGATRICVVSAILKASDVREACRQFRQRLA